MSTEEIELYQNWLHGWEAVTDQPPPAFVTEKLREKLALVLPIFAYDPNEAKRQVYALGYQNARACMEKPHERIW